MNRKTLMWLILGQAVMTALGALLLWATQTEALLWGGAGYWALGWGLLGALASYLLVWWLARSSGLFGEHLRRAVRKIGPLFRNMSWPLVVFLALLAGVGEEILFRAFLQQWLVEHTGAIAGIGIATAIFAVLHYLSLPYCLVIFILGLLMGLAYHFTQSLMLVMVWHTVYDVIALAVLAKFPEQFERTEALGGSVNR